MPDFLIPMVIGIVLGVVLHKTYLHFTEGK